LAEAAIRRNRSITIAGLILLTLLAWAYLLAGAGMPSHPKHMAMEGPGFMIVATMWWTMMIAMMVPSAAPTVLLYARVYRVRIEDGPSPPVGAFLSGYLLCWLVFSLAAAAIQLWLQDAAIASPITMRLHTAGAAGALLILAGLYQLSPLKNACLGKCRSPAQFLAHHYRPGPAGAFRMGAIHGAFCVGCCWLLMALLFVGGVMSIAWIAALAITVAAEKLLGAGPSFAQVVGAALIVGGASLILS